jgi:hypothetical protein
MCGWTACGTQNSWPGGGGVGGGDGGGEGGGGEGGGGEGGGGEGGGGDGGGGAGGGEGGGGEGGGGEGGGEGGGGEGGGGDGGGDGGGGEGGGGDGGGGEGGGGEGGGEGGGGEGGGEGGEGGGVGDNSSVAHICSILTSACTVVGQSSRPCCGLWLHRAVMRVMCTVSPDAMCSPGTSKSRAPTAVKAGCVVLAISSRSNDQPCAPVPLKNGWPVTPLIGSGTAGPPSFGSRWPGAQSTMSELKRTTIRNSWTVGVPSAP